MTTSSLLRDMMEHDVLLDVLEKLSFQELVIVLSEDRRLLDTHGLRALWMRFTVSLCITNKFYGNGSYFRSCKSFARRLKQVRMLPRVDICCPDAPCGDPNGFSCEQRLKIPPYYATIEERTDYSYWEYW